MRLCILLVLASYGVFGLNRTFPPNFLFGAGQSAYQVEGAWNADGKGESIWDRFVHENRSRIYNRDTADVACDSYHLYKEDIKLAAAVGVKMYRFSISWPRILPDGDPKNINNLGLQHYERLVREIRRHHMVPVATIYHWDLPQALMDKGIHWTTPKLVDYFVEYARIIISRLHHVGYWITINEPEAFCRLSYGAGAFAPGIMGSGRDEYKCAYVMLKAHAAVYRLYKKEFSHHKAKMSIAWSTYWYQPKNSSSIEDIEATKRVFDFGIGLHAHPIVLGGWPPIAEKRVAERSRLANLTESRLPTLTPEEIKFINGTFDFFGLNVYTGYLVENVPENDVIVGDYSDDVRVSLSHRPEWKDEAGRLRYVPDAPLHVLKYVKETYNDPEIIIMETGAPDDGSTLYDEQRIGVYHNYFGSVLDAIYTYNVKVIGLNIWSLLDNFEWNSGYRLGFGIYHVDMDDPKRTRYPKKSAVFMKQLTSQGRLPTIESIGPLYEDMMRNSTLDFNKMLDKMKSRAQVRSGINLPFHRFVSYKLVPHLFWK